MALGRDRSRSDGGDEPAARRAGGDRHPEEGGAAVDAAIAASAMLGLVEPMSYGLGGDLFTIVWEAETGRLHGLNGSGRSPYTLTRDVFTGRGFDRITLRGVLS